MLSSFLSTFYVLTLPWPHTAPSDLLMLDSSVAPDAHSSHCICCPVSVCKTDCYVVLRLPVLENSTNQGSLYPRLALVFLQPCDRQTAEYTKLQAPCSFFLWVMLSVFGFEVTKLSSCLSTPLTLTKYCAGLICWRWTFRWPQMHIHHLTDALLYLYTNRLFCCP